jgi:hypothetical protein
MPDALAEIQKEVAELQARIRQRGSRAWFRGHSDARWVLKSRLHRHVEELIQASGGELEGEKAAFRRDEEKSLYWRFRARAWALLGPEQRSNWGLIFAMQHYGVPTRLLDWTESFACALFFAQQGRGPSDDAAIYVLDAMGLNEVAVDRSGILALGDERPGVFDVTRWHPSIFRAVDDEVPTIAVAPELANPRMLAQQATFTLSGDTFTPLEDQFGGELVKRGFLRKLVVPAETFDAAESFLDLAGAGYFAYFPDLDGLARDFEAERDRLFRDVPKYLREADAGRAGGKADETVTTRSESSPEA